MRRLQRVLAVLAMGAATGSAFADEPKVTQPVAVVSNQALADELAQLYRNSGKFRNYSVDVEVADGTVTLTGTIANPTDRAELIRLTANHAGVKTVHNQLHLANEMKLVAVNYGPVLPAQATTAEKATPAPAPLPVGQADEQRVLEPAPVNSFAGGVMPYADTPVMPPYSWPAYTPYNNFASMAYQTQYPSGAWPFIGPPHPYPMIPSGWRKVSLKWRGGYWWLKFHAH